MSDKGFCVTVSAALALLGFVLMMRFLPEIIDGKAWKLCDDQSCNLQGWMIAFSGLLAVAAAFVTVRKLIDQIKEQKRQTDFIVGDARPTMDAIEHLTDSAQMVVRIVNWNRRGIIVKTIDCDLPDVFVMPHAMEIDGTAKDVDMNDLWVRPFPIRGWENRAEKPHAVELRLMAFGGQERPKFFRSWSEVRQITAQVQILGDSHDIVTLTADTRPF